MFWAAFRWSGAAAFAASLAGAGYILVAVWPQAPPSPPAHIPAALAWNASLFTAFAAHHSALARTGVKRWLASAIPEPQQRPAYVWIASALFAATMFLWQPIGRQLYQVAGWAQPLCTAVQVAGIVLVVLAARVIDPLELAGVRPGRDTGLEERGPYRLIRHPIYLGWLLIVWGAPVMTGDRLWFAALSSLYLVIAMPWEEASMRRAFGDAYDRYSARVRWRVLPLIY